MQFSYYQKIFCMIVLTCICVPLIQSKQHLTKAKIHYIKKKYEHTIYKKKCLFYPAKNPKRLLISFCGAQHGIYSKFSWFWRDDENWQDTAYLFVRDDQTTWYLGNNKKDLMKDFTNLIRYFTAKSKLRPDQVFSIGSSMGGYGALLYATLLGFKGALLLNPQVNKASNYDNRYSIARTEGRWRDLDAVIRSSSYVPCVSLIYGHCALDQSAGEALVKVLKAKAPLAIIRRHPSALHGANIVFSKQFIEREIEYIEQQSACTSCASSGAMNDRLLENEVMICGKKCVLFPASSQTNRLFVFIGAVDKISVRFPWLIRPANCISDTAYLIISDDDQLGCSQQSYIDVIRQVLQTCKVDAGNLFIVGARDNAYTAFLSAVAVSANGVILIDPSVGQMTSNKDWLQTIMQLIPPTFKTPHTSIVFNASLSEQPLGNALIDVLRHKPSVTVLHHDNDAKVVSQRFFENEIAYLSKHIPFARDFGGMDPDEELFDDDLARFKQGVSLD